MVYPVHPRLNIIVHRKGAVKPSDMGRCLKTITLGINNGARTHVSSVGLVVRSQRKTLAARPILL